MRIEIVDISTIKGNGDNPRTIKPHQLEKLKKSIKDFPKMLEIRPIVVDSNNIVLGGNMRLKALQELNITEVPIVRIDELTEEQKKEFIIKDNVGYGDWDWDVLNANWDMEDLIDWGLEPELDEETEDEKYTRKIEAPTYEPSNRQPDISTLVNLDKMYELWEDIESAPIDDIEKEFLKLASYRHIVFDYSKIADYYAHADKQTQELMENSGLVIIDYNKAISEGYIRLSKTLSDLYTEDHEE